MQNLRDYMLTYLSSIIIWGKLINFRRFTQQATPQHSIKTRQQCVAEYIEAVFRDYFVTLHSMWTKSNSAEIIFS